MLIINLPANLANNSEGSVFTFILCTFAQTFYKPSDIGKRTRKKVFPEAMTKKLSINTITAGDIKSDVAFRKRTDTEKDTCQLRHAIQEHDRIGLPVLKSE